MARPSQAGMHRTCRLARHGLQPCWRPAQRDDPNDARVQQSAVGRRQARFGINHKQNCISFRDSSLSLCAHACFQTVIGCIFKPSSIDDLKLQIVKLGIMDAPVARNARQVIDQRQLAADEAIEQCGLADIGTPDDGE